MVTKKTAVLIGSAALAAAVAASYAKRPVKPLSGVLAVNRDPARLKPEFRTRLMRVLRAMRRRGFKPYLWEGYRTPQRTKLLVERGVGIPDSLHMKGLAADVVDKSTAPDYWKGSRAFWTALGQETRKAGLTWGGDFKRKPDRVHLQMRRA